jgi:hypothetical protein
MVSSVDVDGLFAHSLLNVSDTCISINGIACNENINATVAATITRTSSFVTIVAKTRHETGEAVAHSAMPPPLTPSATAADTYDATAVEINQSYMYRHNKVCSCIICSVFVLVVVVIVLVVGKAHLQNSVSG